MAGAFAVGVVNPLDELPIPRREQFLLVRGADDEIHEIVERAGFFAGARAEQEELHGEPVALVGNEFFLLRNAPPAGVLKYLAQKPSVPVRKLSHRLLLHLRKSQANHGVDWEQL